MHGDVIVSILVCPMTQMQCLPAALWRENIHPRSFAYVFQRARRSLPTGASLLAKW